MAFMVAVTAPVEVATVACGADLSGESGGDGAGARARAGACLGVSGRERGVGSRGRVPSIFGILEMEGCVVVVLPSRGEVGVSGLPINAS